MWELDNRTFFETGCGFTKNMDGDETWIVAIKATYKINKDGIAEISENQKPVTHAPLFRGEPGKSSLIYDTDFVLKKNNTDVVLNGSAHVPGGKKKRSLTVSMSVGKIKKRLSIKGPSRWKSLLLFNAKTRVKPFSTMPITYENTWGGTDEKSRKKHKNQYNPCGTGYALFSHRLNNQPVPTIYPVRNMLSAFLGSQKPAGYGPLCCDWKQRRKYGGTYGSSWEKKRKPLLPKNFDLRFNQQAPKDQQTKGYLKGGERVTLKNLTPEGLLKFNLPKETFKLSTLIDNNYVDHTPDLYTVILEPDTREVSMVWNSSLICQNQEHLLKKTIIRRIGES